MIVTYGNTTATTEGKLYYLDASNNWIEATNSNSAGFQLAVANGTSSSVDGMILYGTITNATYYSSFSVGGALYVSATSGLMTNTAPSSNIRVLGNSLGSNQIFFSPSNILSVATGMSGYGIASGAGTSGFTQTSITDPSDNLNYSLLRWTNTAGTNSMTVTTAGLFDLFVLGGGGGGGNNSTAGNGGGGGAGQLNILTAYLTAGAYTVIVGAGGAVGIAGGSTSTRSGQRGGFSGIFRTTPALTPRFTAVGGGGGMASNFGGGNASLNSYARTTLFCDSFCGGGGASPQMSSAEGQDLGPFTPNTTYGNNGVGFTDGTTTVGGYYGGLGYYDGNFSATGGGAGIGGPGGDYTGGGSSMRGGSAGLGLTSTFSGVSVGYGGGGGGGHTSSQATQTSAFGGGSGCNVSNVATAGTANTGGGGGGGANANSNAGASGAGGSGLVMVRYRI